MLARLNISVSREVVVMVLLNVMAARVNAGCLLYVKVESLKAWNIRGSCVFASIG